MRLFASTVRRPFNSALAVLVVAALSHCCWEDARELAQRTRTIAQHRFALPSPVQAPIHDCDHEYGCICRGATIVHAIDMTQFKALASDLLSADFLPALISHIADAADIAARASASDHDCFALPISGRQLRALYACLVI